MKVFSLESSRYTVSPICNSSNCKRLGTRLEKRLGTRLEKRLGMRIERTGNEDRKGLGMRIEKEGRIQSLIKPELMA